MTNYIVQISAYFSDTVEVEADSENEAEELAIREFESNYTVVNQFGLPWDNVEVDSVEEDDDY